MVLDVADEGGACYDGTALPLVIRRLHPARERTQTWHWTADGRLRCAKYEHLFVAPRGASPASSSSSSSSADSSNLGAIFRSGNAACLVLGPMEVKQSGSSTAAAAAAGSSAIQIPRTQAVLKQKMRKGSGVLNVSIQADGPSRVLRIRDQQMSANGRHLRQQQQQAFLSVGGSPLGLGHFGVERSSTAEEASSAASTQGESALVRLLRSTELELSLAVDAVGVSVISAANEELIYLFLRRISLEATLNPAECRLRAVVMNFQVDNQLRHCEKEVVLHVGSLNALEGNGSGSLSSAEAAFERDGQELVLSSSSSITPPAITFIAQKLFIPNVETNVFKNLQVSINDLVLNLEEVVLLKLLEFIQYDPVDSEMDEISSAQSGSSSSGGTSSTSSTGADALYHANSRNVSSSLARSAQYYFAYLLVQLSSVKLSVFTSGAHRVGAFLSELKKKAGIKLIRFEDALIQLRPYHRVYSLMTRRFLTDSIKEHYRAELRSQAAKILGTVDFLGNPVGFLNDMADGISDLTRGNLSGLLWSVTHGISDSTAKFTSVLGESLGTVTMDARYQEIRRKIKQESSAAAGGQRGHLSAGALGLAHGLIGGITSLITQTYDGFTQGSVTGVLSGLGKGVLGTITKPAVGVLDFASSAATAVRDSSRKTTAGTTSSDGSGAWEVGGPVRRVRRPRTLTIDGRLTAYDAVQAAWQARFYSTGDFGPREYGEAFVAVTLLQDGHLVMVTTERLLFFHSLTLKRADLEAASAQEEGDLEGDSRLLAENVHHHHHHPLAATDCPVNQLQILALETISEAVHARMRPRDAQRFYRLNGLPAGSSALCLGELFSLHAEAELVSLLELRTTSTKKIINKGSGGGSGANSPRMSASSTSLEEEQLRETGVEYPKALQLCYLYASSPEVMDRLVGLINEAKHLQEERKFEVGVLEGSGNK
ncbi:Vacuolar protein sorting-associated protein 13D [Tyrophagus putrescentiae]|nr:Vacuolar protein sorting-associated protein 13D [Tyrophagus putrescentiae]